MYLLSKLLAPFVVPITAILLVSNGILALGYWQRGKTIDRKVTEAAVCAGQVSLQNQAIAALKQASDAQVARAKQAATVANQIKAQGQVSVARAQSVPITGNCQADMAALAGEFAK